MNRVVQFIDAHSGWVTGFLALGPFLIGFYPATGLVNPIWGSLFGFPLHLAAAGHPVYGPHPWTELAAFLLWPLMMLGLMTWGAAKLISSRHRWRLAIIAIWALSAFIVVPVYEAALLFPGWPIWGAFE